MSRESILHRVRTAVGRTEDQPIPEPPPVRLRIPQVDREARLQSVRRSLEALAAKVHFAVTPRAARDLVETLLAGRNAVASNAPYLSECGVANLPGVRTGFRDAAELREACTAALVGITSADYVLADTGTLVLLSSNSEARLISLLPPAHIAVVPSSRMLTGLDELFTVLPSPADASSSMVLITGPSRTGDIEQILVRGVHGPGELTVVLVG
ncbi:MAG TPA: lactate utilization protein [Bryobacteraceae bacterium]|nr:lactate utilization protein [Bryobacteraceae bacterium]